MPWQEFVSWMDSNGNTRITSLYRTSGGLASPTSIPQQLQALSNACVMSIVYSTPLSSPFFCGGPLSAEYPSVQDLAVLTYNDAAGAAIPLLVPSPKGSLFLADGVTVDPLQVVLLNAVVIGSGTTRGGSLAATFVGGVRAGRGGT